MTNPMTPISMTSISQAPKRTKNAARGPLGPSADPGGPDGWGGGAGNSLKESSFLEHREAVQLEQPEAGKREQGQCRGHADASRPGQQQADRDRDGSEPAGIGCERPPEMQAHTCFHARRHATERAGDAG